MNVKVQHIDAIKGNGLFSVKNIARGSIIFTETPLVCSQFAWNAFYKYKACERCLRPLESAEENARRLTNNGGLNLPYLECCTTNKSLIVRCSGCGIEFCTSECLQAADKEYHQVLCGVDALEELVEVWKHLHYPPETSSIMLVPKIIARIQQSANSEEMKAIFMNFCHEYANLEEDLMHKFIGEQFTTKLRQLYDVLVHCMPRNDVIGEFLTFDGFKLLIALIGRNGQGVGTSAISQWVTKTSQLPCDAAKKQELDHFIDRLYEQMDEHSGTFLNNEGVALYQLQSAINHSCRPNAETAFLSNSSTLSLVALEDIREGEEICISYLDECMLERSRYSRQKELKENYLFRCECAKCIEQCDQQDMTSSDEDEMSE